MPEQTVIVSKLEYEILIRDHERLSIVKDFIAKDRYVGQEDLKVILGVEDSLKKPLSFEEMFGEKAGEE